MVVVVPVVVVPVVVVPFVSVFSMLLQCTGCTLNYYSIYGCCRNERMCMYEKGWGVSNNNNNNNKEYIHFP